jgi:hypothetical protein
MVLRRRAVEHTSRDQAAIKRSVAEIFASAATDLALTVERTITEWRTEMDDLIDETIAAQRRDLEHRRQEIQTLAARDAATRHEAATSAKERMNALAAARTKAEELARSLDTELRSLGAATD